MYTAIKGIYENGSIVLEETPPALGKAKVLVMFIADEEQLPTPPRLGVKIGGLAGHGYAIPDDFNKPLDDFREYM